MALPHVLQAALPHRWLSLGSAITKTLLITMGKQDIATAVIHHMAPSYGLSEQQRATFKDNSQKRPDQAWFGEVTDGETMSPLPHPHLSQQSCLGLP